MSRHIFHVQGSVPPNKAEARTYASHVRQHVIASSAQSAIGLVEAKFPGVTIHNVQHHGIVDIEEQ